MDDDSALHQRLLARDQTAVDSLLDRYAAHVHSLAALIIGRVGTTEDVEEAASDAFTALWERAAEFDPGRATLKSWLLVLTKYAALGKRRRLTQQRLTPEGETKVISLAVAPEVADSVSPEDQVLLEADRAAVRAALDQLPLPDRELLIRRYFLEEPVADLAKELGLTRTAVDTRLWRARQALRTLFDGRKGDRVTHGQAAVHQG